MVALAAPAKWLRDVGWTAVTVWIAVGALGIKQLSDRIVSTDGQERRHWMRNYVRNVREFVLTDSLDAVAAEDRPTGDPVFQRRDAGRLAARPGNPPDPPVVPQGAAAGRRESRARPRPSRVRRSPPNWWGLGFYADGRAGGAGEFESDPLTCADFHRLRFETTGWPGSPGLRLALKERIRTRDAGGAADRQRIGVAQRSRRLSRLVPSSSSPQDASTLPPFGFRPPTEIAWGSAVAETLIQRASWIAGLAAADSAAGHLRDDRSPAPSPSAARAWSPVAA